MFARRWAVVEIIDGGRPTRVPKALFYRYKRATRQVYALNMFAPLFGGDREFGILDLRLKGRSI